MAGSLAQGAALHTAGLCGVARLVALAAVACRAVQEVQHSQGGLTQLAQSAAPGGTTQQLTLQNLSKLGCQV